MVTYHMRQDVWTYIDESLVSIVASILSVNVIHLHPYCYNHIPPFFHRESCF